MIEPRENYWQLTESFRRYGLLNENVGDSQSLSPYELLNMDTPYVPRVIWNVINVHGFPQ